MLGITQNARPVVLYLIGNLLEPSTAINAEQQKTVESPNLGHSYWDKRHREIICDKAKAEAAWHNAERKAGYPLPDWEPAKAVYYECGGINDAEQPTYNHYAWHNSNNTEPCGKSKSENNWKIAERKAGRPLPDWKPRYPFDHTCGDKTKATGPSCGHYGWHKRLGIPLCGRAKYEYSWYSAERRAGKAIPNWEPPQKIEYECGDEQDAVAPSGGDNGWHAAWHRRNGTKVCGKAKREERWAEAERKASRPLLIFEPRRKVTYICGEAEDATTPNRSHYSWHKYYGTKPCRKSMKEARWYEREQAKKKPIKDFKYKPLSRQPDDKCGPAEDAIGPSLAHSSWHYVREIPECARSSRERRWYDAQRTSGYTREDYWGEWIWEWNVPTFLYRYLFEDLSLYWGVTIQKPEERWKQHKKANSSLGRKIRSGMPYSVEVTWRFSNRYDAEDTEHSLIALGNPWGGEMLNTAQNNRRPVSEEQQKGRLMSKRKKHICGSADEATGPSVAHYSWHKKQQTSVCEKAKRENAWYSAERRTGITIENFEYKEKVHYDCGSAEDATGPSVAHQGWHRANKTLVCDKALKEAAWYRAEKRKGQKIVDYQWNPHPSRATYVCGSAEDATGPSSKHYSWHRKQGTAQCDKAKAEMSWMGAERRAGNSIPDYVYKRRVEYECGPTEAATAPGSSHMGWHRYNKTTPCGKSRKEAAWYDAERKAGHSLEDYEYRPKYMGDYECGETAEATHPSLNHRAWHKRKGTEPCGKSKAEAAWYDAERKAGRSLPNWQPQQPVFYECGSRDDAERPGQGHYYWHRWNGTEQCGKALEENAWHARIKKAA